jgi:hypothetical protein
VKGFLTSIYYTLSGDASASSRKPLVVAPGGKLVDLVQSPSELPAWLSPQDLSHYASPRRMEERVYVWGQAHAPEALQEISAKLDPR